jgi:glutathione S-transferase
MQLIGMLDSPYVRRTGISLRLLGVPFEHQPISVFRAFEQFSQINPVVKAPTFVCEDGTVLMDSTLIIDYAEHLAGRSLLPSSLDARRQALRVVGLGIAACEKAIQIVYEHELRPSEKWHEPWLARVTGQLSAAVKALEAEVTRVPLSVDERSMNQAGIMAAVAWRFIQEKVPEVVPASVHSRLVAFSAAAERLPAFKAIPYQE